MLFLYNLFVIFASQALKLVAVFSPKIKLFVEGRKVIFPTLEQKIKPSDRTIWFHAASLGEYEQGLPVIEKIKEKFPSHKIIVTFFRLQAMKSAKTIQLRMSRFICLWIPRKTLNNFYHSYIRNWFFSLNTNTG